MRYLYWLLLVIPLAIAAYLLKWPAWATFSLSGLGIIPLAYFMGRATEELAESINPYVGGS